MRLPCWSVRTPRHSRCRPHLGRRPCRTCPTAANRVEALTQNQYLAGQIAYSDVITAQTTALSARETEASAVVDRQLAAVSLIQAIGGAWAGSAPAAEQLPPRR